MKTLTPSERRALRAAAHALAPVVIIGHHGLTAAVLKEIDSSLTAHELIKVRCADGDRVAREAALARVCAELDAAAVQHLGKLLIIWRPRPGDAAPAAPAASNKPSTTTSPRRRAGAAPRPGAAKVPAPMTGSRDKAALAKRSLRGPGATGSATAKRTRGPAGPTGGAGAHSTVATKPGARGTPRGGAGDSATKPTSRRARAEAVPPRATGGRSSAGAAPAPRPAPRPRAGAPLAKKESRRESAGAPPPSGDARRRRRRVP